MAEDRSAITMLHRVTHERIDIRAKKKRRESTRRMFSIDNLPMPRCYMRGPRWRSAFEVKERPIAEIDPIAATYHRPGRKLLLFSLEGDIRELLCRELRPGVLAEWSDPREEWL